jgi:uncharacterized protein YwqG
MKLGDVLPEFRVILHRLPPGERAVELEYPNNIGKRTKLGGTPDWIQTAEIPVCPECREEMTFVAQIDSIDYIDKYIPEVTVYGTEQYMFGDVGIIYTFFCFNCLQTTSVFQSY